MNALRAPPRSVGAVVRAVRASRAAFLALECALLFLAGAWLARSAALLSGADGTTWSVGLFCGVLCAAAWWLEHPLDLAGAARVLDRRLGHAGALLTAFELEEERRTLRDMEELVRARVLARLRPAAALRVMLPSPAVPLAAPLLAAAVLAFVHDARAARVPVAPALGTLAAGLERALAANSLESDVPPAEIAAVRAEVRALAARLAADPGAHAGAETALAELDRRIAALAAGLPPPSPARAPLQEARLWLDALAVELGLRSAAPTAAGTATGELTDAPADGTISGSFPDPAPPMTPAPARPTDEPASAGVPDLGRQAGTFWPAAYDTVVERWIELSRAAHEAGAER